MTSNYRETHIELDRDNLGHAFIGANEVDEHGYGVRSYVLSSNHDGTIADVVMERRFEDFKRLMAGNIAGATVTKAFENPPVTLHEVTYTEHVCVDADISTVYLLTDEQLAKYNTLSNEDAFEYLDDECQIKRQYTSTGEVHDTTEEAELHPEPTRPSPTATKGIHL
jgi:hypothetical protein